LAWLRCGEAAQKTGAAELSVRRVAEAKEKLVVCTELQIVHTKGSILGTAEHLYPGNVQDRKEWVMNEEPDPRNRWQRASPDFRGMNPTLAVVGLGAVCLVLVVLMLARGGHDDARPPEPVKPGVTRPG
jgi:hypothetical protein